MKKLFAVMILSGALAGAEAIAQEHKHEEQKEERKAPVQKGTDAAKADSMRCCEGMDKMGEMKQGMPMKGDMKAKMEKMKGMEGMKMKDMKNAEKPSEPNKDQH
jgi:hypothetical protein